MKITQTTLIRDSAHHGKVNQESHAFFSGQLNGSGSFFSPVIVQPKLKIGSPDDQFERQADRVAEAVVSSPASVIQQESMEEEEETLQLKCSACEEEKLQMKSDAVQTAGTAPPTIAQKIQNAGGGNRLPETVSNEMSQKMGADFSDVNIHTGPEASRFNESVGARAFTHGTDVFFNSGEYNPGTREGKRLLAHELTHVVQQKGKTQADRVQRNPEEETIEETDNIRTLDTLIPEGTGFYLQTMGGVTWGIPVYTGGTVRGELFRSSEDILTLIVYKQGRVGGDTGAGAGFYIGTRRRQSQNSSSVGVGAEAGVNAELGLQVSVIEQYNIPADDFFLALSVTSLDQVLNVLSINPVTSMAANAMDSFMQQYSDQYLIRTRYELGLYGSATGEISAGLRRPTDHARDNDQSTSGANTWTNGERRNPSEAPRATDLDPLALLNFLRQLFVARVSGELNVGIDHDRRNDQDVVKMYAEGQLQALLSLPIPFISQLLALLPGGIGAGVELIFEYQNDEINKVKLNVYQFSGEDELFLGNANKQSFSFDLTNIVDIQQLLISLSSGQVPLLSQQPDFTDVGLLENTEFWYRFSLMGPVGRRFRTFLRRQSGARSLLSDRITRRSTTAGLRFEPYFTINIQIPGPDFIRIIQMIPSVVESGNEAVQHGDSITEKMGQLIGFLTDFEDSNLVALTDEILNTANVTTAELRLLFGAGLGIGGRVAEGAKVRADISAEGGVFCAKDLLEGENKNHREVLEQLHEVIENPLDHLPNCQLLGEIYRGLTTDGSEQRHRRSEDRNEGHENSPVAEEDTSGGRGSVSEDETRIIRHETSEFPEEVSGNVRIATLFSCSSIQGNSDYSSNDERVHTCSLYFRAANQTDENVIHSIIVQIRVIGNDVENNQLNIEFAEGLWIDSLRLGIRSGTQWNVDYERFYNEN